MTINLYMKCPATEVLGPFRRYALWVQGCSKQCKGCISPEAQPIEGGTEIDVGDLAAEILSVPEIEGITISGGEPFLQQDVLVELVNQIKSKRDLGVIVYTGMLYAEIKDMPLAQRCDLIVDGEYIEELNDDMSLRGSSNQEIICLTDRYAAIADIYYGQPGRKVEFVISDNQISMVGIPTKSVARIIE